MFSFCKVVKILDNEVVKIIKNNTNLKEYLQHPFKKDLICTQNYINTQFIEPKIVIYF